MAWISPFDVMRCVHAKRLQTLTHYSANNSSVCISCTIYSFN